MTELNARVGANIRALRKEQGLSARKLASMAGIGDHIYVVERGERGISLALAIRIAEALDCELDHLVYGVDDAGSAHARQAEM